MQSGTDVVGVPIGDYYMWWEMLDAAHPNPEVVFANSFTYGGDDIDASTIYDAKGKGVTFNVVDYTLQMYHTTGEIYSYRGDVTPKYYDGSTSEAITEAPSGGPTVDGLYYLRKPLDLYTYIAGTFANNQTPDVYKSEYVREVNSKGTLLQTSDSMVTISAGKITGKAVGTRPDPSGR